MKKLTRELMHNMKYISKKSCLLLVAFLITLIFVSIVGVSLAWFEQPKNRMNARNTGGALITQYFHCGTGAEDDPFVITRPVHYFNLVNLYQRVDGYSNEPYFFQVGYDDLEGAPSDFWVYDYNDDGTIKYDAFGKPLYSKTLNLSYYSGENALLPIGTHDKNFLGTFDGKGLTIQGLTVSTKDNENVCDIGIFGYVGGSAAVKNIYFDSVTIDLTNVTNDVSVLVDVEQTHNPNAHHIGDRDVAYVGYIAGHAIINSQFKNVFVNNVAIRGGGAASSRFGYFGCLEKADGTLAPTLGESIGTEFGSGDGAGWGGSLDMKKIQSRLQNIWVYTNTHNETKVTTYPTAETIIIDEANDTVTHRFDSYGGIRYGNGTSYEFRYYTTEEAGKYYFFERDDMSNYQFMLMYGEDSLNPKTVSTYTLQNETKDAWLIYDENGHYLSSSGGILSSSSPANDENTIEASNTKWIFENGYLYSISDGTRFYLNRDGATVTLSQTGNTVWTKIENALYTTSLDDVDYYLYYDMIIDGWRLTRFPSYYRLSDGNGNYMTVEPDTWKIQNTALADGSVRWHYTTNADDTVRIFTEIDGQILYLNNSSPLSVSETPADWTEDERGFYLSYEGVKFYLVFDGNAWKAEAESGYKLSDGANHYLAVTGDGAFSVSEASATVWQIVTNDGTVQAYTVIGNERYYLSADNGRLSLGTAPFTWNETEDHALYFTIGGEDYYIIYDNGWLVSKLAYYVIYSDSNYLCYNGTAFGNETEANATHFYFGDTSGEYPSGTISFNSNGILYFLQADGTQLTVTNAQGNATAWLNDGSSLKVPESDYALGFTNAKWGVIDTTVKLITDGNGNYMTVTRDGNNYVIGNTTSTVDATAFTFSDGTSGTISAVVGGTTVYLQQQSNTSLRAIEDSGSATSWSNDGNNLYYTSGFWIFQTTYYMVYNNNNDSWIVSTDRQSRQSTIESVQRVPTVYTKSLSLDPVAVSTVSYTSSLAVAALSSEMTSDIFFLPTSQRLYTKTVMENQRGGYQTYFPIRTAYDEDHIENSENFSVAEGNTGYVIGGGRLQDSLTETDQGQKNAGDLRISYFPINISINGSYSENGYVISKDGHFLCVSDSGDVTDSEELEDAAVWSGKSGQINTTVGNNTYYLTNTAALVTTTNPGLNWSNNNDRLYVRNANNPRNYYYLVYDNGWKILNNGTQASNSTVTQITVAPKKTISQVYTINDGGRTNVTETTTYRNAKANFEKTLNTGDTSHVYGLHFMDAKISKDCLVSADKAVILGETYYDYEMPVDSIDFHVIRRGAISFFAGEYFNGNNAFFSLHQIFRDENQKLLDILEIKEVYEDISGGILKPYIYKYENEDHVVTYSNEDGTYSGATELAEGYRSVFKTDWITNPSSGSMNAQGTGSNRVLFYFEIPCNAGEYALGSVPGKTGAYLNYLDISANGGAILDSVISSDGNDVTNNFQVDVRSSENIDVNEFDGDGNYKRTILQIAVDAPATADLNDFSVSLSYQSIRDIISGDITKRLYTISVTNKTADAIDLTVFICDNDDVKTNSFDYYYEIVYTNDDRTSVVYTVGGVREFQRCTTYTVPNAGGMT